jgi:DNA gyrase subunit A
MQLGSLANLERENLQGEHRKLLDDIAGYLRLLSNEDNIRAVIREDMLELKKKYGTDRRTEITDDELTDVDPGDLITEEPMVVTLSQRGYIKRTPLKTYQAQNRGGKGIKGAATDEEDPIAHLFVASTHDYLLFFTTQGKVYWQKVYDLPLQQRVSKGRALVNLLSLKEDERVSNCQAVSVFDDDHFLLIATRAGIVKKTALSAYSRPMKGGIIAIKLDEGDELIDVRLVSAKDDVVLATRNGMSIRFSQDDARGMGRATRGVKGITLSKDDSVVGMVVAKEDMTLLTVCENGYGKRTPFGPGELQPGEEEAEEGEDASAVEGEGDLEAEEGEIVGEADASPPEGALTPPPEGETAEGEPGAEGEGAARPYRGNMRYRRQRRGGKGLRDIRTSSRNGKVIDVIEVAPGDEVLMVTGGGKIQRIRAADISQVGRNTQGVRVIRLDEGDTLVSIARIPEDVVSGR